MAHYDANKQCLKVLFAFSALAVCWVRLAFFLLHKTILFQKSCDSRQNVCHLIPNAIFHEDHECRKWDSKTNDTNVILVIAIIVIISVFVFFAFFLRLFHNRDEIIVYKILLWEHASLKYTHLNNHLASMAVADLEGCSRHAPPPPMIDYDFVIPFCIRMLKNKAQIARESIKNPRASRALKLALDPGRKLLRVSPPPWKSWICPSIATDRSTCYVTVTPSRI